MKFSYSEYGEGKSIVILHGWLSSAEKLMDLAKDLSLSYKVIVPDLPGFGSLETETPENLETYSQYVSKLIDKFHPICIVGHSFGGLLVSLVASESRFIPKIVLISPSGIFLNSPKKIALKILAKVSLVFLNIFNLSKYRVDLKKLIYSKFIKSSDLNSRPDLEHIFREVVRSDARNFLGKITAKTLLIWGDLDRETPLKLSKYYLELVKNSELKLYANCTHNIPYTQHERIAKDIKEFLDD